MSAVTSVKSYGLVATALLGLLVLTVGAAYLNLGALNTPVAMAISVSKAALIMIYFMHLRKSTGLVRLMALVGFFWLGIMLTLALSDYFTR